MSFLSKFLHKSSTKAHTMDTLPRDGIKHNTHKPSHKIKSKSKKALEKDASLKKVNLCKVYNRDENYKPVNPISNPFTNYETLYARNIPKFKSIIEEDVIVNMEALQKLAWQGVPVEQRPMVWKLLLNYVPVNKGSREATIARKREEYASFVQMYCVDMKEEDLDETEKKALKVVKDDVHRTQPDYPIFHHNLVQELMTRLLWVWHVRHPASGYVQGINDLITPFLAVFLKEHINEIDFNTFDIPANFEERFTPEVVSMVEADTYWCVNKILEGILDIYTFSQSGTHKALDRIKDITKKIDPELFKHLQKRGVDFTFFSFRWMFCLLVREFPLKVGMRLFDTYIADDQGFSVLHAYVCATLLMKWSLKLKKMSFTDIMVFLQNMPTKDWSEEDLEMLISEAYVFKTLYDGSFTCITSPSMNVHQSLPTSAQTDRLT